MHMMPRGRVSLSPLTPVPSSSRPPARSLTGWPGSEIMADPITVRMQFSVLFCPGFDGDIQNLEGSSVWSHHESTPTSGAARHPHGHRRPQKSCNQDRRALARR